MKDVRGNIEAHLKKLCFDFPSRHCGSAAEKGCAEYIEKYFCSLGFDVCSDYYPVRGWNYRSFEMYNETKNIVVPAVIPNYFSCSCDVRGNILVLGDAELEKLDNIDTAGRICLITSVAGNVFDRGEIAEALEGKGTAAAIFISRGDVDSEPQTKLVRNQKLEKIAVLAVSNPGVFHLLKYRNDTFRLRVDACNFDTRSRNVIARIGNGRLIGVLGAHYDTAPLLQGADDDGSGTAMLLELARLLRDIPINFSVDLCAFSAEEYIPEAGGCPPGSGTYVDMHKDDGIKWMLNLDSFGGQLGTASIYIGHPEKLPELNYPYPTVPARQAGDDKAFHLAGIPTIWLYDIIPFHNLHTPLDTFEKVNIDRLAHGVDVYKDIFTQLAAHCS